MASIVASQKLIDPPDGDFEDLEEELFPVEVKPEPISAPTLPPTPSPPAPTKLSPPPSPKIEEPQSPPSQHPPIVLRIFKGTSQLISSTGGVTPESGDNSPSREVSALPAKKEHRRRSHGSDSGGDGVSPKRHKNRDRDRDKDRDRDRSEKKVSFYNSRYLKLLVKLNQILSKYISLDLGGTKRRIFQ